MTDPLKRLFTSSDKRGFTIIELLIVIVIIGILASIVIAVFNDVQRRANNTARHSEGKSWQKTLEVYRAAKGTYPAQADGAGFCLGKGFPSGAGGGNVPRCRDYDSTGVTSYLESNNTALMTEIASVASIPSTPKKPVDYTVGPFIIFGSTFNYIVIVIEGTSSDCPGGTTPDWGNGRKQLCNIILEGPGSGA